MNKYKLLFFTLLIFVIASCNKETNIDEIDKKDDPTKVEIEITNSLLERSVVQSNGLDMECFTILYPFSVVDINNKISVIQSESDFTFLFQDSVNNTIVDFVYPLSIDDDGIKSQINNIDELSTAFAECVPDGGWTQGDIFPAYLIDLDNSCYTMVFPISLKNDQGSITIVNNETELNQSVASEVQYFVYPFALKNESNTTTTVTNNETLFNALISCGGFEIDSFSIDWETGFNSIGCYELKFPANIVLKNGSIKTVNNHEELCALMLEGKMKEYAFPLTIINENNEEIVVNNIAELEEKIEDCTPDLDGDFGAFLLYSGAVDSSGVSACFTINFPVTLYTYDFNGNEQETIAGNLETFVITILNGGMVKLKYPVSVVLLKDNSTVTIEKQEDLFEILAECK
jgi:hypothetical protein